MGNISDPIEIKSSQQSRKLSVAQRRLVSAKLKLILWELSDSVNGDAEYSATVAALIRVLISKREIDDSVASEFPNLNIPTINALQRICILLVLPVQPIEVSQPWYSGIFALFSGSSNKADLKCPQRHIITQLMKAYEGIDGSDVAELNIQISGVQSEKACNNALTLKEILNKAKKEKLSVRCASSVLNRSKDELLRLSKADLNRAIGDLFEPTVSKSLDETKMIWFALTVTNQLSKLNHASRYLVKAYLLSQPKADVEKQASIIYLDRLTKMVEAYEGDIQQSTAKGGSRIPQWMIAFGASMIQHARTTFSRRKSPPADSSIALKKNDKDADGELDGPDAAWLVQLRRTSKGSRRQSSEQITSEHKHEKLLSKLRKARDELDSDNNSESIDQVKKEALEYFAEDTTIVSQIRQLERFSIEQIRDDNASRLSGEDLEILSLFVRLVANDGQTAKDDAIDQQTIYQVQQSRNLTLFLIMHPEFLKLYCRHPVAQKYLAINDSQKRQSNEGNPLVILAHYHPDLVGKMRKNLANYDSREVKALVKYVMESESTKFFARELLSHARKLLSQDVFTRAEEESELVCIIAQYAPESDVAASVIKMMSQLNANSRGHYKYLTEENYLPIAHNCLDKLNLILRNKSNITFESLNSTRPYQLFLDISKSKWLLSGNQLSKDMKGACRDLLSRVSGLQFRLVRDLSNKRSRNVLVDLLSRNILLLSPKQLLNLLSSVSDRFEEIMQHQDWLLSGGSRWRRMSDEAKAGSKIDIETSEEYLDIFLMFSAGQPGPLDVLKNTSLEKHAIIKKYYRLFQSYTNDQYPEIRKAYIVNVLNEPLALTGALSNQR